MLDMTVPSQTRKLSSIGPGYYLNGRTSQEFQVLLVLLHHHGVTIKLEIISWAPWPVLVIL
jgi:hypothetical protein